MTLMRKSSLKQCTDRFGVSETNHNHTDRSDLNTSNSTNSNDDDTNNIVTARSNSDEDDYDDRECEDVNTNLDQVEKENECNTTNIHSATEHKEQLFDQETQPTIDKEDSYTTDNTKVKMPETTDNDTDRRENTHKSTFTELVDNILPNKTSNDQDIKCELLSTHEPECNQQSENDTSVVHSSITVNTPLIANSKSYVCSSSGDDKEKENVTESNEMLVEACNSTNVANTNMTDSADVAMNLDKDKDDNDNIDNNDNECESSDDAVIDDNDNFEVNMDELAEVNSYLQATGNSPVTPRLMHRIQKEQRRERAAMKRVLHPNAVFVNNTKASPIIAVANSSTTASKISNATNNEIDGNIIDEEKISFLKDDVINTQLHEISASMSASSNTSVPRHSNKNTKTKKVKSKNNNGQVERVSVHGYHNAHSRAASSHYSRSLSSHSSHSFSSAEQHLQHLHSSSRHSRSNSSTCSNNSRNSNSSSNRRVHKEEKLRRQRQHRRQRQLGKRDKTHGHVSMEVLLQNENQEEEQEKEKEELEELLEVEEREEETQMESLLPKSAPREKIKSENCEEYVDEETNHANSSNYNELYDKIEKSSSAQSLPTLSVEMVLSSHRDSEVSFMPALSSLSEKHQTELLPHEIDNFDVQATETTVANYKQQNTEESEEQVSKVEGKVEVHKDDEMQEMRNHKYELERSTHISSRRSSSVAASESLLEPISEQASITNSSFSSYNTNEEEEEEEHVKIPKLDSGRNNDKEYSCLSDNDKTAFSAHVSTNKNNNNNIQNAEKVEREENANVDSEIVDDHNKKTRNEKSIKIKNTISVFKRLQHNTRQLEGNAIRTNTDKDKSMKKNKEHASTFARKSSSAAATSIVKDPEL